MCYLPKFLSNSRKKSESVTPIFTKHNCCSSCFHLAHKVLVWMWWMLSALLHMGRLICACTTAICLMWLVWGFFGIPKVATIRLRRPYMAAECMCVCNIFQPAFQLKKKKITFLDQEVCLLWQHCNSLTQIHLSLCSAKAVQVSSKIKRHKHCLYCCTWSTLELVLMQLSSD